MENASKKLFIPDCIEWWYRRVLCYFVYVQFTHHAAWTVSQPISLSLLIFLIRIIHTLKQWYIIPSRYPAIFLFTCFTILYFLERGPLTIDGWYPRDHMPDDYPKNEEERRAAAIKYGMRPEDYKLVVIVYCEIEMWTVFSEPLYWLTFHFS